MSKKIKPMSVGGISLSDISVDWIHYDDRGEIFCFYEGGVEYTILTTRKGFARGGCVHEFNDEHFVVLKGKAKYHVFHLKHGGRVVCDYEEGECGIITAGRPHYYVALEDSITLEWGATTEEKMEKHKLTRKIVDEINANNLR